MLQVVQTRIMSVTSWYYLAFFIISMAMFGLTAGAVHVTLEGGRFTTETAAGQMARAAVRFAGSIAVALMLQMSLADVLAPSLTTLVSVTLLALVLAVPYFFAGVVLTLALTRSPFPVSRVYGVDLCGAGLGCIGALALLNATDGPSAVLWIATAAAGGSIGFAMHHSRSPGSGPDRSTRPVRGAVVLGAVLAVLALANGLTDFGLRPIVVKGKVESTSKFSFVGWNSFSRVVATRPLVGRPFMWGESQREALELPVEQVLLNVDGEAGTSMIRYVEDTDTLLFLAYDVTNLAHALPGRPRAAIIGAGGGRDVLSALLFGREEVIGIDVNPIFIELLTEHPELAEFAGLAARPNVTLVADEARSWLTRSSERFDLIQMSLVDTWAATGAGAFTLSENGLYTEEAWVTFLEKLNRDGVFTVSRWYHPEHVYETGRLMSLAVASLLRTGVARPREHIFVAHNNSTSRSSNIATLIVAPTGFVAGDLETLEEFAAMRGHTVLASPTASPDSELLTAILDCRSRAELDRLAGSQSLEFRPATDNWPFFFNHLRLDRPGEMLARLDLLRDFDATRILGGVIQGNMLALITLLTLVVVSAALVVATIIIPLRGSVRDVESTHVRAGTGYFLLIGMGFMLVEVGLLQRISVFLGHPSYSLSLVLFTLITATGAGSLLSGSIELASRARCLAWAGATGAYLLFLGLATARLLPPYAGSELAVRAAVAVLLIAPAGLLMGFGFPTGIRLAAATDTRPTPWFWGVNGAAGVLAGGLAVLLGMTLGIAATLTVGGLCYLALPPALLVLLRGSPPATRPHEGDSRPKPTARRRRRAGR
jgi:hypothetical protein